MEGEGLPASSGQRLGIAFNILHGTGQFPSQRIVQPNVNSSEVEKSGFWLNMGADTEHNMGCQEEAVDRTGAMGLAQAWENLTPPPSPSTKWASRPPDLLCGGGPWYRRGWPGKMYVPRGLQALVDGRPQCCPLQLQVQLPNHRPSMFLKWKCGCLASQFADHKAPSSESEMLICFSNMSTGEGREESEQERQ